MKVGIYFQAMPPGAGGGYTLQMELVRAIAELAARSRHKFVILTYTPDSIRPSIGSDCIQVIQLRTSTSSPPAYWIEPDNRRSVLEETARANGVQMLWFPGVVGQIADLPYVATVCDLQHRLQPFFPEVQADGEWDRREAFFSRYVRRASLVIVGTQVGRTELEYFFQVPTERIRILPHPTPRFALDAGSGNELDVLKKYNLDPDYIFYPAQSWSHKNHANLLLALQLLQEKYSRRLPAVFVGSDRGNEGYVRQLIEELGLNSQIRMLGFVPVDDLIALYRNAFALTYVSFFGPENLPPLEAFALGCPVIASDVSGAREQLGDAALFIDPRSPDQIARAIMTLLNDDGLRRELIERGSRRARSWTPEEYVQGIFALFDEFETVRRCWA